MPKYFVDFEVLHDKDSNPLLASNEIDAERPPESEEEFRDIARAIYNKIKKENPDDPLPYSVRVLRVAEDSEELRGLIDVLNKNSLDKDGEGGKSLGSLQI